MSDEDLDSTYQFQSASEILPDHVLFGDASPNDLQQGMLGDCWLLSAFAAIAEYPAFVESIIKDNGDGTFEVTLYSYADGDFTTVEVDDHFPATNGMFAYCHHSKEDEIWPCVLEKAFAKLAGGYSELALGFSTWAFGMLTGATSEMEYIKIDEDGTSTHCEYAECPSSDSPHDWSGQFHFGETMDTEALMELLVEYDQEKYLMCAGSHAGKDSEFSDQHIVLGHAYTILQAAQNPAGSEFNLLKLRNPWGKDEWQGPWADGDAMWDTYGDVAQELGYEDKEDGAFWMPIENFVEQYGSIFICKHNMEEASVGDAGGAGGGGCAQS